MASSSAFEATATVRELDSVLLLSLLLPLLLLLLLFLFLNTNNTFCEKHMSEFGVSFFCCCLFACQLLLLVA